MKPGAAYLSAGGVHTSCAWEPQWWESIYVFQCRCTWVILLFPMLYSMTYLCLPEPCRPDEPGWYAIDTNKGTIAGHGYSLRGGVATRDSGGGRRCKRY